MDRTGKREIDPRLKELFDAKKSVWSISRANTVDHCLYEAYLTYVKHIKGKNGVYGILGGKIHDTLEGIMIGENTETDLLQALTEELENLELLNIDFPKDRRGKTSIRENWIADMTDFCTHFTKPQGEFITEQLFILPLGKDRYIQGYIDLIRLNKNGTISIYDWKTSTVFSKDDLLHHGRQLILYCLGKENEGFRVTSVNWIMLKYCEVTYLGKARKNAKQISEVKKVLNRRNLVKGLKPELESSLCNLGYSEADTEIFIKEALKTNSLDGFPQAVQDQYEVKPYVQKYEITEELKTETLDYLHRIIDRFESLDSDNESAWKHREFVVDGKEDVFYCRNLCNHRNNCPHIRKYLDTKTHSKSDEEDLF